MKIIKPAIIQTGARISEIDMTDAGLSIIKDLKLLSISEITKINKLPKHQKSIYIGKLAKNKYKNLAKDITSGINLAVKTLIEKNKIDSNDILKVRRDAVFVIGPPPLDLGPWPDTFGNNVKFRNDNTYDSILSLDKIEILSVLEKRTFVVKGISDENVLFHKDFIIEFILDFLTFLNKKRTEKEAFDLLKQFKNDYSLRKLPVEFYRTFDANSSFIINNDEIGLQIKYLPEEYKKDLNITYNFNHVILPLINAII
jgi:hypothetical protein